MRLTFVASRLKHQRSLLMAFCVIVRFVAATPAAAQSPPAPTEAAPAASIVEEDDDTVLKLAEPDFGAGAYFSWKLSVPSMETSVEIETGIERRCCAASYWPCS